MKNLLLLFVILATQTSNVFAQSDNKVLICISSTAKAYHSHRCMGLNKCTHSVGEVTIKEAKDLGRTPCGFCYKNPTPTPSQPGNSLNYGQASPPASKPCSSVQCTGITQKGARCKNTTTSCSGKCYHHD